MEEASRVLSRAEPRDGAPKLALAAFLCVISPVCLISLAGLSSGGFVPITETAAAGIGLCVLMILVAIGVTLFITSAAKVKDFEFIGNEPFETEYGVSGMVREREREFREKNSRLTVIGTGALHPLPSCRCSRVTERAARGGRRRLYRRSLCAAVHGGAWLA